MRYLLPLLLPSIAFGAPTTLTHSGRALDAIGEPLNVTSVPITVSLYGAADGSDLRFRQTFSQPVADGYYAVTLSTDSRDSELLDTADLDGVVFLGVDFGGAGDSLPRQSLTDVPSAARAVLAETVAIDTTPGTVPCEPGAAIFDTTVGTGGALRICNAAGDAWVSAGAATREIAKTGGVRRWSDGTLATTCQRYRFPGDGAAYAGDTGTGVYEVDPDGDGWIPAFTTWCEMDVAGGGWSLVYAHNYTQGTRTQLFMSSLTDLLDRRVAPAGPTDTGNFRIPMRYWNSLGTNSEILWRAKNQQVAPAGTPSDLWIHQTATGIDPGGVIRTGDQVQIMKSHACLNETVVAVHTAGLYQHTGGAGNWTNQNCAGPGAVPWTDIGCWCSSMGNNIGEITPTGCGTTYASGNLFYNNSDASERCGSNAAALSDAAYANVLLYVR